MPVAPKTINHPDRETLTLEETAIRLGTSTRHIRELARDGRLPIKPLHVGRRIVVSKRALEQFLSGEPPRSESAA